MAKKANTKKAVKKAAASKKPTQSPKTTAAKKGLSKKQGIVTAVPRTPAAEPLTHRLDALLHTMRCIAQHEDQLCTLLHDARRTGRLSATLRRELQDILADLPAEEYTDDLHAVLEIASAA